MHIHQVHLHGFGRYRDPQTIELFPRTVVVGTNGSGKSTLLAAMVWCLYGTDLRGVSKQDDKLLASGASEMTVSVHFTLDDGSKHIVERTKSKRQTVVLLDGSIDKRRTVTGWFGEVEEFLSTVYPTYFSLLPPIEARRVLAKCLPEIPQAEVFAGIPDAKSLESLKLALGTESADYRLEKERALVKEESRELERLKGQQEALQDLLKTPAPTVPVRRVTPERVAQYEADQGTLMRAQSGELQSEWERQIRALLEEYKQQKELRKPIPTSWTCPTCEQPLPPGKAKGLQDKIAADNALIEARMQQIADRGKALRDKLDVASSQETGVDPLVQARIVQFEQDQRQDAKDWGANEAKETAYQEAKEKQERCEVDIARVTESIAFRTRRIQALTQYRVEYATMQARKLQASFSRVTLDLIEVNRETGEIRSVLRIKWDGQEYGRLSTSERVRCDMEIAQVLSKARAESMPLLVDNAESVLNLFEEPCTTQIIALYVADRPLTVQDYAGVASRKRGA